MNYSFLDQKLNTKPIFEGMGEHGQWRSQPLTIFLNKIEIET
jgi:hypothetical protein